MRCNRREMFTTVAAVAAGAAIPKRVRAQTAAPIAAGQDAAGSVAQGTGGVAATVHPLATEAAIAMMREGGNAVDAAVAAALMLAVVDGENSGLGGGCFILVHTADGRVAAIDGRETAPAAAHERMFLRDGVADPRLSQTGALASGVPGAVAAYHLLADQFGTGRWGAAARGAAEVAEAGFELSEDYAALIRAEAKNLARFEASRQVFLDSEGEPWSSGHRLVQTDLARTLREIALDGPEAFYQGRFAERLAAWMADNGGIITAEDMARYRPRQRVPLRTSYHGHEVIGFPPPSSGGVHVAQILGMIEPFDMADLMENHPVDFYHVLAEAMRLAFADRAEFLGDPSFVDVPRGLIDSEYLRQRGDQITRDRRIPIVTAGAPPRIGVDLFGRGPRHTTHLATADAAGNWVAITSTVNTSFGSKVVVPETGVIMNNQMDDFAIAPGVPNAFGLVGNAANAPAPGKRPLSSMSPTIVLRDGRPVLTCGAAGGPRIISAVTQILLHSVALESGLASAVAAPRIHHQWVPDRLVVERTLERGIVAELERRGHVVQRVEAIATAQGIARSSDDLLVAVAEPRLPGAAGAYEEQ